MQFVVVALKSPSCGHCTQLGNIWPNVVSEIKKVYPSTEFLIVEDINRFPPSVPQSLRGLVVGVPTIVAIEKSVWSKMGPESPLPNKGIYVFGIDGARTQRDPEGLAVWIKSLPTSAPLPPSDKKKVVPTVCAKKVKIVSRPW